MSQAYPPDQTPDAGVQPKPRFIWPMRIFLFVFVFNMVFRNFSALVPWQSWVNELEMRDLPVRLPTQAEINHNAAEDPAQISEDVMESLDSAWEFWRPWPGPRTRPHLGSAEA